MPLHTCMEKENFPLSCLSNPRAGKIFVFAAKCTKFGYSEEENEWLSQRGALLNHCLLGVMSISSSNRFHKRRSIT